MKKIGITLFFTFGIFSIIIVSCCRDNNDYWMPKTIGLNLYSVLNANDQIMMNDWSADQIQINDSIEKDTVLFIMNFDPVYVSQSSSILESFALMNAAYATPKCEGPGSKGLKHQIKSIELSSNQSFSGIPSGSSLNSYTLFKPLYFDSTSSYSEISVANLNTYIDNLSNPAIGFDKHNKIAFALVKTNSNVQQQKFNLRIVFENDITYSIDTPSFTWN